ncbi:s-cell enriched with leucine-rich repeat-containing protein slra-related [Anaeramoeba flamelloides]|uniref:S-cell enriched with leucine-rich repeat-containing protein slra-related n=1 Tax=Anaeramoeba flamelloides TaxID=1746091 RepID=A0AAV7ZSE9_9EUKA|nr:s-cell enriched with leucine-rich repeat-containing protein slra-related [Anaeramoeba flamelloides]
MIQPETSNDFCFFHNLPEEIVLYIFQYLKPKELVQASLACKGFHYYAFDPYLWNEVAIKIYQIIDKSPHNLYKKIPTLKGLRYKQCMTQHCERFINSIAKYFPELYRFEMNNCTESTSGHFSRGVKIESRLLKGIGEFASLRKLTLSSLKFQTIPLYLNKLTKLTHLSLAANRITELPPKESMNNLKSLTSVNLSLNNLNVFPTVLSVLPELRILNLSWNSIKKIPDQITDFTSLLSLNMEHNRLSQITNKLNQTQIRELYFSCSYFVDGLPEGVTSCDRLTSLDISHTSLKKYPIDIQKLKSLNTLNLAVNHLGDLGESLWTMKQLQKLDIRLNNLDRLPLDIGNLSKLQELIAFGNNFETIPYTISKIPLVTLKLQGCGICWLPEEFGSGVIADTLWYLDLSENKLTNLPDSFGKLKKLSILNLSSNTFTDSEIPEPLFQLKTIKLTAKKCFISISSIKLFKKYTNSIVKY